MSAVRLTLAAGIILATFCWAAPCVRLGGFGGILILASLAAVIPFLTSMIADRAKIVVGVVSVVALVLSFVLHDFILRTDPAYEGYARDVVPVYLALTLGTSLPAIVGIACAKWMSCGSTDSRLNRGFEVITRETKNIP